ncbi:MAG TPA: hypothetical protein VG122_16345, partial [Gemmata sp.]|nr:hypothetical protein [Gemmata sp.]
IGTNPNGWLMMEMMRKHGAVVKGCLVHEFGWPGQSLRCSGVAKQQFVFSLRESGASKTLPRPPSIESEN